MGISHYLKKPRAYNCINVSISYKLEPFVVTGVSEAFFGCIRTVDQSRFEQFFVPELISYYLFKFRQARHFKLILRIVRIAAVLGNGFLNHSGDIVAHIVNGAVDCVINFSGL